MTSKLRGRLATVVVFVFFALIYFSTLYRGISPGAAAHNMATALGLESGATQSTVNKIFVQTSGISGSTDFADDPRSATMRSISGEFRTRHMVWRMLVRGLARHVPFGSLAGRLNSLSALLGALTIALAFALCRGLILFINFHDSPVSSEGRKVAAAVAGLVSATALGLSGPFWLASTRAMPYVFDAFLVLLMGWMLFVAMISQRTGLLFLFGLVCGVTLFESDTGLFVAILLLAFAIRAMVVGAILRVKSWCLLLTGLLVGIVSYAGAVSILFDTGGETMLPIRELLASVRVNYSLLGGGIFGDQAKLISVFFIIIPFFAMCALAMWRDVERNTAASGFLLFLLSCATFISLIKTPISPWSIYSKKVSTYLPVMVFILAAATAGYLASAGAIMAEGRLLPPPKPKTTLRTRKEDDFSEATVGRILVWFILALTFVAGLWNLREVRDGQDEFVEAVSVRFLDRLGGRTWIASTTPELDTMLKLNAWERRQPLHIIPHGRPASSLARMRFAIKHDEAFRELDRQMLINSLNSTNLDHFVSFWIASDPAAGSRLLVDSPQLWSANGRIPVPAVVAYRAQEKDETIDWNAIADEHLAFWRELKSSTGMLRPAAPSHLRRIRSEIRAYLCDIGEYLADQLVKVKDFPATKVREILDCVEDIRTEPSPAEREEVFY